MNDLKLEILYGQYWEHFKFAKDLALILPLNHPKRIKIENAVNEIQSKIKSLLN